MPENKYVQQNEYVQEYLQYGGQAIIEGVMMRSPSYYSVACRTPEGNIVSITEKIEKTWIGKQSLLKKPFLRGSFAIFDSMALGSKAMKFASRIQLASEEKDKAEVSSKKDVQSGAIATTMVIGIAIGLFLFDFIPNYLAEQLTRFGVTSGTLKNLATEILKIIFFIGYISLISLMPEIKRVFMYHGAEHKSINALEALEPLDEEHALKQTRLHPRCGTSFAIIVLMISLLFFTFVPRYPLEEMGYSLPLILNVLVRVAVEIILLPIVTGVAYELLRYAGRMRNQKYVMLLFKPGLWSQYLTTREPDRAQIEVALVALTNVIDAEKNGIAETKLSSHGERLSNVVG